MAENTCLQIGQEIRRLRKEQNLTQEDLAARSGVDYKHIQLLEGKNPPAATVTTLKKLAKGLGLSSWTLKFK